MNPQPSLISLVQLRDLRYSPLTVAIDQSALPGIRASAALVQKAAPGSDAAYGVNTDFGKLANQRIAQADLETLQVNLLCSHAVGVGEPMAEQTMQLALPKEASLARGFSAFVKLWLICCWPCTTNN